MPSAIPLLESPRKTRPYEEGTRCTYGYAVITRNAASSNTTAFPSCETSWNRTTTVNVTANVITRYPYAISIAFIFPFDRYGDDRTRFKPWLNANCGWNAEWSLRWTSSRASFSRTFYFRFIRACRLISPTGYLSWSSILRIGACVVKRFCISWIGYRMLWNECWNRWKSLKEFERVCRKTWTNRY